MNPELDCVLTITTSARIWKLIDPQRITFKGNNNVDFDTVEIEMLMLVVTYKFKTKLQ